MPPHARNCCGALDMQQALQRHDLPCIHRYSAVQLRLSVAATFSREGDDLQSLRHVELAVADCQSPAADGEYLEHLQWLTRCHLELGRAHLAVGRQRLADQDLQQAMHYGLLVFHGTRATRARATLIEILLEHAALCRHESDFPQARQLLQRAGEELQRLDDSDEVGTLRWPCRQVSGFKSTTRLAYGAWTRARAKIAAAMDGVDERDT